MATVILSRVVYICIHGHTCIFIVYPYKQERNPVRWMYKQKHTLRHPHVYSCMVTQMNGLKMFFAEKHELPCTCMV